jgi:hypothetical protein
MEPGPATRTAERCRASGGAGFGRRHDDPRRYTVLGRVLTGQTNINFLPMHNLAFAAL